MTGISLQNGVAVPLANLPKGGATPPSDLQREWLAQQKGYMQAVLRQDSGAQLAHQNAQEVHTAFRLNGELVGTIDENGGFTASGISDGGASQRAAAYAEQTGLKGAAFADYVSQEFSQALKERYGASLEVVTYNTGDRPTIGEMHTEMFGPSSQEPQEADPDKIAHLKFIAQLYAQTFGEDPFTGKPVSSGTQ